MTHARDALDVSEQRACRVFWQSRAVQRYTPIVRDDERPLTKRIIELAGVFGRCLGIRARANARSAGWSAIVMVNYEARLAVQAGHIGGSALTDRHCSYRAGEQCGS